MQFNEGREESPTNSYIFHIKNCIFCNCRGFQFYKIIFGKYNKIFIQKLNINHIDLMYSVISG